MTKLTDARIIELEEAERKLRALESHGVDGWCGYDDALEEIRAENYEQDLIDRCLGSIEECLSEAVCEPAGIGCGYGFRDCPEARDELVKFVSDIKGAVEK